jgi:hypothetical protein
MAEARAVEARELERRAAEASVITDAITEGTVPKTTAGAAAYPSGFAKAQDSGFSFGAEFGIAKKTKRSSASGDPYGDYYYVNEEYYYYPYIMPMFAYDGFLIGETLKLYAYMGIPLGLREELWFWLGTDINFELTYNTGLLSFIVENALTVPIIKGDDDYEYMPYYDSYFRTKGSSFSPMFGGWYSEGKDTFTPKLKYDFYFNTGTLYLQTNLPINILPDAFGFVNMHLCLGWKGGNGLGLEISEYNFLKPKAEFFQRLNLRVSYETASFYGDLGIGIPTYERGIELNGITISPKVEFTFTNKFKAYASLPIMRLGSDYYDTIFGLAIGVKKNF